MGEVERHWAGIRNGCDGDAIADPRRATPPGWEDAALSKPSTYSSYGGAVHSSTNPDVDTLGNPALAYYPAADKRSWAAMFGLFDKVFGAR